MNRKLLYPKQYISNTVIYNLQQVTNSPTTFTQSVDRLINIERFSTARFMFGSSVKAQRQL